MRNILITGGTGFIGTCLRENAPKDAEITAIGRADAAYGVYDYVIHCAPVSPEPYFKHTNERFLYISSGAARHLKTPYAEDKRKWEREALNFGAVVARCYSFVGPHLPLEKYAIGNFIRDGLAGGPIRVRGNGKAIRSYLYETDMAAWLWSLLDADGIYEVGSPYGFKLQAVARMVAGCYDVKREVIIENREGEPCETYLPSGEFPCIAAQRIDLPEAIFRTVKFHRDSWKVSPP